MRGGDNRDEKPVEVLSDELKKTFISCINLLSLFVITRKLQNQID